MVDPFKAPENTTWTSVSTKLRILRTIRIFPFIFIPDAVIIVVSLTNRLTTLTFAALAIGCVVATIAFYIINSNYKSWGYLLRQDDLWIRHGRFFQKLTVVPYGRMQLIDITAGPIERFLKISTVKLHTAAATTDAEIIALELNMASELKDALSSQAKSHLQGI